MTETNETCSLGSSSIMRDNVKNLIKTHRFLCIIVCIAVLLASVVLICTTSRKHTIVGTYSTVYYKGENNNLALDNSYLIVSGVDDSTKKSEIYLRFFDDLTTRIEGNIYFVKKSNNYEIHEFHITKQTGTALEKTDYILLYYFPNMGDHGIIRAKGNGVTFEFIK